jgi:hypothetical protein
VAATRAHNVYREPPKCIGPAIIIYCAVSLAKAEFLALTLNLDLGLVPRFAALDAFPNHKRRPRLGGLLCVMANETVPSVEIDVQKQKALAALLTDGPYEKEEPAVDFSGARDNLFVPLVRLAWEQKVEGFTAAQTANSAREW